MSSRPSSDRDVPVDRGAEVASEQSHATRDVLRAPRPRPGGRPARVLAAIALGGGLGSVARHLIGEAVPAQAGHFPWATFLINVSGCFALGLLMVYVLDVWPPSRYIRPFFGVGLLGGYTTFSTFTVEILRLAQRGAWTVADSYALGSLAAGLAAVWCGMALARRTAGIPVRGKEPR